MRTSLRFVVTGTTKTEIEDKLKVRLASYLGLDESGLDTVFDLYDIEAFIFVGEEAPGQLTFSAECTAKLR